MFNLILADPPWRYGFSRSKSRSIENQYPTMSLQEICALPVKSLAAKDAVLLLWTTAPKLREGLAVMEAWGFTYKTFDVWHKVGRKGMGYYWRCNHEPLLLGVRGHPPVPLPANRPDSCFDAKVQGHSVKPEVSYARIERMYPDARKLELFARSPREGWDVWGNEVTPTVQFPVVG